MIESSGVSSSSLEKVEHSLFSVITLKTEIRKKHTNMRATQGERETLFPGDDLVGFEEEILWGEGPFTGFLNLMTPKLKKMLHSHPQQAKEQLVVPTALCKLEMVDLIKQFGIWDGPISLSSQFHIVSSVLVSLCYEGNLILWCGGQERLILLKEYP